MSAMQSIPREGQVIKFRKRYGQAGYQYMRLIDSAVPREMTSGTYLRLWGYKCRANGLPTHIQPSAEFKPAADIEIVGDGDA